MSAERTAVDYMVKVELCEDCPLREMHANEPDYIRLSGTTEDMQRELYMLSEGHEELFLVDGVRRPEDIIEAFNSCDQPHQRDSIFQAFKVVCGAVNSLKFERS
ncbi:hypothetical protein KW801_00095 [Candidatus Saccharibacteria bacterium]|nr:hypothetical protein [Candidatus Saccharibacteria bacterium]